MYPPINNSNIKKYRSIILLFILLLIIFVIVEIYNSLIFHIVSINPKINSISVISPFIEINTNKILSKNINVSIIPASAMTSFKVNGKQIYITLNPILKVQKYNLHISNFVDIKGDRISDQNLIFTPSSKGLNNLPNDQISVYQKQQSNYDKEVYGNNILDVMPFTGPNFEYLIDYNVNSSGQTVYLIYYDSTQGKTDALNWLTSQGLDIANSNIQYIFGQVP